MNSNVDKHYPQSLEAMRKFAEVYAQRTNTFFCTDFSVTAVVIEGLAKNKDAYGAALCPCRHYDDKKQEVLNSYWNCPCVPMRSEKVCSIILYYFPSNEFSSSSQKINIDGCAYCIYNTPLLYNSIL
uniref:ferredoxin-thioredoxin reductase beta subunit n=1 Tax=Dixoniella grisea TaxID=35153 RepID=UPI001FCD938F|nr:ferredoxin-thioredoxin reductase beta subunit [Dixoniella grisea]UNJ17115.1 ferredoxin-thioredoxin reductase beta subunit [Dixoniella grisea]